MMLPICSFIIPAYNANKTILRCLDSIYALALDMSDFEVIIIDDCSKDNTVELLEGYKKRHANITLLCQTENHRQGAARNRGVSVAKGKYIIFVDSDDESAEGVVAALHLAEKYNLDMVAMHYVNVDENGNTFEKESITLDGIFTGIEMQTKHPYWGTAPWPYIYKASFLRQVNYPFVEDVVYEDADFVAIHLYHVKYLMYSSLCGYKNYYNATSTTHVISYKHVTDYMLLGTRMLDLYNQIKDKTSTYAHGILEGGCYNIRTSCRRLIKLASVKELFAFYHRLDSYLDRLSLFEQTKKICYMTWCTKLCLGHKFIFIGLIILVQLGSKIKENYNIIKKIIYQ